MQHKIFQKKKSPCNYQINVIEFNGKKNILQIVVAWRYKEKEIGNTQLNCKYFRIILKNSSFFPIVKMFFVFFFPVIYLNTLMVKLLSGRWIQYIKTPCT